MGFNFRFYYLSNLGWQCTAVGMNDRLLGENNIWLPKNNYSYKHSLTVELSFYEFFLRVLKYTLFYNFNEHLQKLL